MSRRVRDSSTHMASLPAGLPVVVIEPDGTSGADDGHDTLYRVTMLDPRADAALAQSVPAQKLGAAIARFAESADSPVRVEVHHLDGSVYADVIQPPATDRADPTIDEDVDPADGTTTVCGFLPGEQIFVAIVVQTERADEHGRLHLPLDALANPADQLPVEDNDQFVLVGATSHIAATRPRARQR